MPLIIAIILFLVFTLNVGLGAALDRGFLNDVTEALLLGAVVVFFVIAILKREADAQK